MSSRCPMPSTLRRAAALLLLAPAAASAQTAGLPSLDSPPPPFVAVTGLFPGDGTPPPPDPTARQFQGNPVAIRDGQRLFNWYNCSGCHFHGGGGMGPPLMSNHWRYGGRLDQIFESISQGRPNGMPSWHGKLPDRQIWELAAFVKSLATRSSANGTGQPVPQTPPPPVPAAPPPLTAAPGTQSVPPQ